MKTATIILIIILLGLPVLASDTLLIRRGWQNDQYYDIGNSPRIGLALSGGGARGLSQIGVLKAFEEAGLKISAIAGTSIGGIIGGLYSSGYSAEEIEKITRQINFSEFFTNRPNRTSMFLTGREEKERSLVSIRFDGLKPYIPKALTAGQKLTDLLSRLTLKANYQSACNFNQLPIPFKVVTTDIVSGAKVVIDNGNLSDAMRATMAFPLAFTGVEKDNMILMDGGMVDPIPVDIVREMNGGIDYVIAVNTASDLLGKDDISHPIDIANQVTTIMTMDKLKQSLALADIIIKPEISNYLTTSFDDTDTLINIGYLAGLKAIDQIINEQDVQTDTFFVSQLLYDSVRCNLSDINIHPGRFITFPQLNNEIDNFFNDQNILYLEIKLIPDGFIGSTYQKMIIQCSAVKGPDIFDIQYRFSGNTVFDQNELLMIFAQGDSILTTEKISNFSDKIEEIYQQQGYDLAHIRNIEFSPELNQLDASLDEGLIEKIELSGNHKTKNWLITSNFGMKAGDPFNFKKASSGISNIYATDLFERVALNISPGDNGAIISINVVEKKYIQMRVGWHWHDEYKSEQFVEFLNDNLLGTGQEFLTHIQYGNRRQSYFAYLKADQFFSTYLTYRLKGFYSLLERRNFSPEGDYISTFKESRFGAEFILGQQISRLGTATGEIRFEEIENDLIGGVDDIIQLRSVTFRSHVETFDQYPYATSGKRHLLYVTFAADILGGETEFTKFFSSIESYFPITEWFNFHPRLVIGHINTKFGIPSSERFYLGGHYSMYGFATDELVGAKLLLLNMETRTKLPFGFYLHARYDMGEVYSSVDQIKTRNLRHAVGFSLSYDSPIGPIDFGWGKSGTHPDRAYIDIGLNF